MDDIVRTSQIQVKDLRYVSVHMNFDSSCLSYLGISTTSFCLSISTGDRLFFFFLGSTFWAEEVIRVWKTLRGILRHLAVLKYMQIMQKHEYAASL